MDKENYTDLRTKWVMDNLWSCCTLEKQTLGNHANCLDLRKNLSDCDQHSNLFNNCNKLWNYKCVKSAIENTCMHREKIPLRVNHVWKCIHLQNKILADMSYVQKITNYEADNHNYNFI